MYSKNKQHIKETFNRITFYKLPVNGDTIEESNVVDAEIC